MLQGTPSPTSPPVPLGQRTQCPLEPTLGWHDFHTLPFLIVLLANGKSKGLDKPQTNTVNSKLCADVKWKHTRRRTADTSSVLSVSQGPLEYLSLFSGLLGPPCPVAQLHEAMFPSTPRQETSHRILGCRSREKPAVLSSQMLQKIFKCEDDASLIFKKYFI